MLSFQLPRLPDEGFELGENIVLFRIRLHILDNVTLYWLTDTAMSSARLYWDNVHFPSGGFFDPRGIKTPVAVSAFPDEIYQAPKSWVEKAYPKLIFYNRPPRVVTSQPGNSRHFSRPICAQLSSRFASRSDSLAAIRPPARRARKSVRSAGLVGIAR
ncbi:epoxide hydrolase domain-containing protein [Rhizobium sp. Pop5]|nr:epoxide hydrolase domain-containing protein [Rhizobium sp. Pop5]